jgi:hypothetical protein
MVVRSPVREAALARPVLAIAGLAVLGLLVLAGGYGFHRDELYFIVAGRHPAWGYVDQPPLTPLLSALGVAVFGTSPAAARVLPALVIGALILLTAAMTGTMGGDRRAQLVAAASIAVSGILLAGHLASTATYDLLAWALMSWLVARILGGGDPRLWLAVGLVGGIGLLNKTTILLLPATLGAGLLLERRWSLLRSPWPWAGIAVALVIGAPNLAWQAANGFPQAEMARHIAAALGSENRSQLLPLQVILAGPLLFPVVLAGIWRLVRAPAQRPWRAFAWAYLLALAVTYWQAGKSYYVAGFFPVLFAAGSIAVAAWLGRGRRRLRGAVFGGAWAVSGALVAVLTLPILPPPLLASSGVADINGESGEQVGWPELVATVERVAATLSPEEAGHAAIVTANYGEAGALELLGRGLPPVYSGHNGYWSFGQPADDVTTVILVGDVQTTGLADCPAVAAVDNGIDLENEELGALVRVCHERTTPWSELWPAYRELN